MESCSPCGASTVSRAISGGSSSSLSLEDYDQGIFNYDGMPPREAPHDEERIVGIKTFVDSTGAKAHRMEPNSILRDDLRKQQCMRSSLAARCSRQYGSGGVGLPPCPLLPASYRARMVGWMREVSVALGLQLSTLFTATSVLDRFIAASEVRMYGREVLPPEGLLQLVTLASMSVAVKYDEVHMQCATSQAVSQAVWLSLAVNPDGKQLYSARDLQRCEFTLLQTINWRLHQPNTYTFLEHFLTCLSPVRCKMYIYVYMCVYTYILHVYNEYVMWHNFVHVQEASLLDGALLSYDHSAVAMACIVLAERVTFSDSKGGSSSSSSACSGGGGGGGSPVRMPASGSHVAPKGTATGLGGDCAATLAAVTTAAGLPLPVLAPCLVSCMTALEGYYQQLKDAAAAEAAEAAA
ncbi:D type cyclin [Volvox carteri f. nagariensis]|uniref:D type cyclin n=1 Tax=Volvox carteri f. nagariensis TaxID=3068 RepID=D8UBH7_VOLCA|nr:D type cyclin [Volvox carteri f. nagariensis]EFJ42949.1 D type cyclin [Volvox carteri f. nagariensis]|eukprot:XP_002955989.1 D type cyclin [Volvox carteri f. nagariensis]